MYNNFTVYPNEGGPSPLINNVFVSKHNSRQTGRQTEYKIETESAY